MSSALRVAAAAAAIVAVVAACATSQPQSTGGVAGSAALSPSPAVSPPLVSSPGLVQITVAGTELNGSILQLTVQLPEGWTLEPYGAYRGSAEPPEGLGFFVSLLDDTFQDPCSHTSQRSPKIGSTVAAAATALGQIPHTTATQPVQTTIAGQAATYLELTLPASLPCAPNDFYLWQDSLNGDWWAQGLDETLRIWILEVQGQRVVMASRSWPGTSEVAKAERQRMLDSIVFGLPSTQPRPTATSWHLRLGLIARDARSLPAYT